jgi:hypothetical protein
MDGTVQPSGLIDVHRRDFDLPTTSLAATIRCPHGRGNELPIDGERR